MLAGVQPQPSYQLHAARVVSNSVLYLTFPTNHYCLKIGSVQHSIRHSYSAIPTHLSEKRLARVLCTPLPPTFATNKAVLNTLAHLSAFLRGSPAAACSLFRSAVACHPAPDHPHHCLCRADRWDKMVTMCWVHCVGHKLGST